MGRIRVLFVVMLFCVLSSDRIAEPSRGDANAAGGYDVTIGLTRFDVKGETLELRYEIVNASDHDVWICDGIETNRSGVVPYEVYVDPDGRTLVIRRRLAVPMQVLREFTKLDGCYVRLAPGQRRESTFASGLPVQPRTILASKGPYVARATRLVLEIGYYDEDLPARIHSILEIADKLKCTVPSLTEIGVKNVDAFEKYFGGLSISKDIGGLAGFSKFWKEGSDRINIPWHWQINNEELSLKVVTDGVMISM